MKKFDYAEPLLPRGNYPRIFPLNQELFKMANINTSFGNAFGYPDKSMDVIYFSGIPLEKNTLVISLCLTNEPWACTEVLEYLKTIKYNLQWTTVEVHDKSADWIGIVSPWDKIIDKKLLESELKKKKNVSCIKVEDIFTVLKRILGQETDIDLERKKDIVMKEPTGKFILCKEEEIHLRKNIGNDEIKVIATYYSEFPIVKINYIPITRRLFRIMIEIIDEPGTFLELTNILKKYSTVAAITVYPSLTKIEPEKEHMHFICDCYLILQKRKALFNIQQELIKNEYKIILPPIERGWKKGLEENIAQRICEKWGILWEEIECFPGFRSGNPILTIKFRNGSSNKEKIPAVISADICVRKESALTTSKYKFYISIRSVKSSSIKESDKIYCNLLERDDILKKMILDYIMKEVEY